MKYSCLSSCVKALVLCRVASIRQQHTDVYEHAVLLATVVCIMQRHCERRHSHSNMVAQICMCSFTFSPLRQIRISEEGLSLFWTVAAMSVCEPQSFC